MTCMHSKTFSMYRIGLVVLITILAFAVSGNSFVDHTPSRNVESTNRKNGLQVFGFSTTRPTFTEEEPDQQNTSIDRRSLFLTGASVAAGYFLKDKFPSNNAPAILTTLESSLETGTLNPSILKVSSVEEALN